MGDGPTRPKWLIPTFVVTLTLTVLALAYLFWPGEDADSLGPMPTFTLTNQDGQTVHSADLKGKLLVISLIYTSCTDICPVTTTRMKALQDELRSAGMLGKDALLLSISVDPERDTVPVLKEYAARYGADTTSWHFLTGGGDYVRTVVVGGFMLGVEKLPHQHTDSGTDDTYEVAHSDRIVVVDRRGVMRSAIQTGEFDPVKMADALKSLR